MPFRPHAKQHQVEAWKLPIRQIETSSQILFVLFGGLRSISFFTLDAMHLLRIHWGFGEHRFRGHPKIAFCVIRGYMPFVTEKELDLAPRHHGLQDRVVDEQPVERFRRRATGERDGEGAFFANSFLRRLQEFRCGCLRNGIGIRQNSNLTIGCYSLGRHSLRAPLQSLALWPPEPHSAQKTDDLPRSFAKHVHRAPAIRRILPAPSFRPHSSENHWPGWRTMHPERVGLLSNPLPPCPRAGTAWRRPSCSRT